MIITAFNPDIEDLERSFLANSVSASATALVVKNVDRFVVTDRLMVGEMGQEKTEVVTLGTITAGTGLTVGAVTFPHSADDPVYKLRYDQIKFYRSTTGPTGNYSLLTTVDIDVDNESLTTLYDDATGIATYYYKVSYYNSVTTSESSLSDPVLGSGYTRNSVGFMIDEILREVGDEQEQFVSRTEMLGYFNECSDDLITRSKRPFRFLRTRVAESRTAGATTLVWPTNMYKLDRLEYNDGTSTYPVRVKSLSDFRYEYGDGTGGDANDSLQFIALDDTSDVFRLWPRSLTSGANAFYIYYFKTFTQLDSEGDIFETDTPRVYKLYALHKFYMKKSYADPLTMNYANAFLNKYEQEVSKLKRAENKDAGSPKGFKFQPQDYKGFRRY